MSLITSVLTFVSSKAKVSWSGYLMLWKEETQSACQWEKEKESHFCILVGIWQRRDASKIHLIPASADLIYLTFLISYFPYRISFIFLPVSMFFVCLFWSHVSPFFHVDPGILATGSPATTDISFFLTARSYRVGIIRAYLGEWPKHFGTDVLIQCPAMLFTGR